MPARPLSFRVAVSLRAPDVDRERLREIARWGIGHCPVTDAEGRVVTLETVVEV